MRSNFRPAGQCGRSFIEDARRAQIISCTIATLAEVGYAQTSLARIAKRAGISKGVISYHFAGKEELLVQVVLAVYSAGQEYMTPRITAEASAPAMLAAYLQSNIEYIRDHSEQMAAVVEVVLNLRDADGTLRFISDATTAESAVAGVESILRMGQRDGDFREFDTRAMAWAVRDVIDGVQQRRTLEGDLDFDTCIAELINLFDLATRKVRS
ncbi:MAG: TetR/AcrR family transcriptional regulator [Sciscionella sp.]